MEPYWLIVILLSPLPVLLVIADQQDFYFQEYNDTRNALLSRGVPVTVAATTTNPSIAHAGSGQGSGSGVVVPTIALANADPANYSAIAFVGGWGSSMYQYAFNDPNLEELATFGLVRKVLAKGALAAVEDMLKEDRKVFRERAAGFVASKESATRVYHRFIRERYMNKAR